MRITCPHRWLIAGFVLAIASALVGIATVRTITATRQDDVNRARAAGERALAQATDAHAQRWAPGALADAQDAFRAGLISERIARASLWPIPDFAEATARLADAATAAQRAAVAARRLETQARTEAQDVMTDVADTLRRHAVLAPALGADARHAASRARLARDQANLFYRDGEYELALARARDARALTQTVLARVEVISSRYADEGQLGHWRQLADDTLAWSRRTGSAAIVISKVDHRLTLYIGGRPVRDYDVDLSDNWMADKSHAGDGAIPEGRYHVTAKKGRGQSLYHKALLLDYPNAADRRAFAEARREGRLHASTRIGGLIEIHGNGGQRQDWTNGCVALQNPEMDELFARVQVGTPVTIIGATTARTVDDLRLSAAGAR